MKRVALVFVLAVLAPSLVLAWLAVRSPLRDQQYLIERQQSLLYQGLADSLAAQMRDAVAESQTAFVREVDTLLHNRFPRDLARSFDDALCQNWPLAQVGFVVTADGEILNPAPSDRAEARTFFKYNSRFLANREPAEIYWNPKQAQESPTRTYSPAPFLTNLSTPVSSRSDANSPLNQQTKQTQAAQTNEPIPAVQALAPADLGAAGTPPTAQAESAGLAKNSTAPARNFANNGADWRNGDNNSLRWPFRNVAPQQQILSLQNNFSPAEKRTVLPETDSQLSIPTTPSPQAEILSRTNLIVMPEAGASLPTKDSPALPQKQIQSAAPAPTAPPPLSRIAALSAEFRQLIGDANAGTLARFVENKLVVLLWYRPAAQPEFVFGAQLSLPRLIEKLHPLLQPLDPKSAPDICLALLDDTARPVALSSPGFQAAWKRPFVATEIGEMLPHWEVSVYLRDPAQVAQSAHTVTLALGLLVAVLVAAIGIGGWLIVADLNRQLALARQKTDFVSNVSHELKTPLTSIRMFSELLAEGRVPDSERQHSFLAIISAEAARLTRLINNVLDFSRLERGEKKYDFQPTDLAAIVREGVETLRAQLETNGFHLDCSLPERPVQVKADRDALAQVVLNLLSNAEKYSGERREIQIELSRQNGPSPAATVFIRDRGLGVPRGSEEKIFDQFYRAHDSLSSGIQGSGLGLTLARQIARAHGGDVTYEARPGGGSVFSLSLPLLTAEPVPTKAL